MKSTTMARVLCGLCLISALNPAVSLPSALAATNRQAAAPTRPALTYADIVDLADAAPLVIQVRIFNMIALPPAQAANVPPGYRRYYIEAQVEGLIRGDGGVSPTVRYLYDAPLDARGKPPKLKKASVILFARRGGRPGEIQLIARDAQLAATATDIGRVRTVLSDLVAPGAPPRILDLGDAFHVAGTVAGEGETQIFLRTENGQPVSLSILRRPGQEARWAVALGEIVDEAARPPERGSLLWYRLACGLPPALPSRSVRTLATPDAEAARADYQLVIQALGRCDRTRPAA